MASFKLATDVHGVLCLKEETLNEQAIRDYLFISPTVDSQAIKYIVDKESIIIIPSRVDASNAFGSGAYRIVSYTTEHLISKLEEETQEDIIFISAFRYYHFRYVVYYYYAYHLKDEELFKSEFRKIQLDKILKNI